MNQTVPGIAEASLVSSKTQRPGIINIVVTNRGGRYYPMSVPGIMNQTVPGIAEASLVSSKTQRPGIITLLQNFLPYSPNIT